MRFLSKNLPVEVFFLYFCDEPDDGYRH